jgi:hypothetical protein
LYKDKLFYYQSGLDPIWKKFSLGSVLFGYCFANSIKFGLTEFHFLRGNEQYKWKWTKSFIETKTIYIINNSLKARTFFYIKKIKALIKMHLLLRNKNG